MVGEQKDTHTIGKYISFGPKVNRLKLKLAAFISYLNRNEIGVKLTQESLLENILANPAPTIPF